jgi:uncharacterized protein involved in propanediol utilization
VIHSKGLSANIPSSSKKEITSYNEKRSSGTGYSICHHGELLQGEFYCEQSAKYLYGLITLKYGVLQSKAVFYPTLDDFVRVIPDTHMKSKNAAEIVLDHMGVKSGGELLISSSIEPLLGLGSSTADVVSTFKAVSNAFNVELDESTIATLAVRAEAASDSVMFDSDVLFAQRDGVVIETFESKLPAFTVLGFDSSRGKGGVDTLKMGLINYTSEEKEMFNSLRIKFRKAVQEQNVELLGEVSTQSALINQKYCPKEDLNKILEIMKKTAAVGLQVAHSGTLVGLIWKNNMPGLQEKIEKAKDQLKQINIHSTWVFTAGS